MKTKKTPSRNYASAKKIIANMDHWLGTMIESCDDFSKHEKSELLHEIEQAKLNLHLVERLIVFKTKRSGFELKIISANAAEL